MKVYIFGNKDYEKDKIAFEVVDNLDEIDLDLEFIEVKPNQDLPFEDDEKVVLMDAVEGIKEVKVFDEQDLDKIILSPRTSAHDYDLGFQLKYLIKLNKLKKVKIVGLPMSGEIDYDSIQSIFKKLVAQDIQGS